MGRNYRKKLTTIGQNSPRIIYTMTREIIDFIKTNYDIKTICDVGCGNAAHSETLKNDFKDIMFTVLDFSEAAINRLQTKRHIFQNIILASSDRLPFEDKQFDVTLCCENLEHLYQEQVIAAVKELIRVSRFVIITIPKEEHVINKAFLDLELVEAKNDMKVLKFFDYNCLEGAIHKSVIFKDSLYDAGFKHITQWNEQSQAYYCEADRIDVNKLYVKGIKLCDMIDTVDLKKKYIHLLEKSYSFLD